MKIWTVIATTNMVAVALAVNMFVTAVAQNSRIKQRWFVMRYFVERWRIYVAAAAVVARDGGVRVSVVRSDVS